MWIHGLIYATWSNEHVLSNEDRVLLFLKYLFSKSTIRGLHFIMFPEKILWYGKGNTSLAYDAGCVLQCWWVPVFWDVEEQQFEADSWVASAIWPHSTMASRYFNKNRWTWRALCVRVCVFSSGFAGGEGVCVGCPCITLVNVPWEAYTHSPLPCAV